MGPILGAVGVAGSIDREVAYLDPPYDQHAYLANTTCGRRWCAGAGRRSMAGCGEKVGTPGPAGTMERLYLASARRLDPPRDQDWREVLHPGA